MKARFVLACALFGVGLAYGADPIEVDAEKLHEGDAKETVVLACTYSAAQRGQGFAQTAAASASGTRSLDAILDDACARCATNRLACRLGALTVTKWETGTGKGVEYEVTLGEGVDVSCPRDPKLGSRIGRDAKATLKEKRKVTAQAAPAQGPAMLGFPFGAAGPVPGAWPGWYAPPAFPANIPFHQDAGWQDFQRRQDEAFRWYSYPPAPRAARPRGPRVTEERK